MQLPRVLILGYAEAAMLLRQSPSEPISAILSIHGQREFGVERNVPHRLDLTFDDIDVPAEANAIERWQLARRQQWRAEQGLIEAPPTPGDAAAIAQFARTIKSLPGILLCHCHGGMSRAPAAALICLATWRGAGSESDCVSQVRHQRPGASPHVGLIRFADDYLCRGGALVRAAAKLTALD